MQDIHRRFEAAFNAGDIAAILALYESEAVFVASGGEILHGHEEIRTAFEGLFAARARIRLATVGIVESTEGLVLMHGRWALTIPGGEESQGTTAEVVRRQPDGSWKYAIDNPFVPCS